MPTHVPAPFDEIFETVDHVDASPTDTATERDVAFLALAGSDIGPRPCR